jgi:hypothetical protein
MSFSGMVVGHGQLAAGVGEFISASDVARRGASYRTTLQMSFTKLTNDPPGALGAEVRLRS